MLCSVAALLTWAQRLLRSTGTNMNFTRAKDIQCTGSACWSPASRSPPSLESIRNLACDRRGSAFVELLVVIAIFVLGSIVAVRTLSDSVAGTSTTLSRHIAALTPFASRPGTGATASGASVQAPAISRQELAAMRGRSPAQVSAFWNSLTPAQRDRAIQDHPDVVGWLDGVPSADRDLANRIRMQHALSDARARRSELQAKIDELPHDRRTNPRFRELGDAKNLELYAQLRDANERVERLEKLQGRLDELGSDGLLLGLDENGDGRAIVAVGNPDYARHTAFWVPGLGSDLGGVSGNIDRVEHLQEAASTMTPDNVSTIMWLGYDAPEWNLSVVKSDRSKDGAGPLQQFADGLHVTHGAGDYHVTAMGHSYGSTVVAEAALRGGFEVDDLVTAGSPGLHTDRARNLNVDPRHVWVGAAQDDPVAAPEGHRPLILGVTIPLGAGGLGYVASKLEARDHGPNPQSEGFGGNRYAVDTHGHTDYWTPNSGSLMNQARVIAGQYDAVELEHGQAPADMP